MLYFYTFRIKISHSVLTHGHLIWSCLPPLLCIKGDLNLLHKYLTKRQ